MSSFFSHVEGKQPVLSIVTPEGVVLELEVASILRRGFAFMTDVCIIFIIFLVLLLITFAFSSILNGEWGIAGLIIGSFLVRYFYFAFFETIWSGRTIGKRVVQIRVVNVSGRPLSASSIFLRNVTRDMELFLPLAAIFAPEIIWTGAPGWMGMIALVWVSLFALFPFLNRRRARIGDLIAGTMVASIPKPRLLKDLAETKVSSRFVFSAEQLDMYGVYELQTLEGLLHRVLDDEELNKVAEVIAEKIDISKEKIRPPRPFLEALYLGLRERHESRLIFGDVQERKKEGRFQKEKE